MNDNELVDLLLENYTEQYDIYKSLLADINSGFPPNGETVDMGKVIRVLEERKKAFERIQVIDDRIKGNKIGWDRRKNDVHTLPAETLKMLLKNIRHILSQVMEANRRLEEMMTAALKKKER
jgi:hypothetical protein